MGYTSGYLIDTNGSVHEDIQWRNPWRGAMMLWTHIAKVYLDPKAPFGTNTYLLPSAQFLFNESIQSELWSLANDETQPVYLRIAQMICFDRAILRREDFIVAADALDSTHVEIGNTTFADQAKWLRKHANNTDIIGACFNVTSVSESHWYHRETDEDGEVDESRSYNINCDEGHWFIEIPKVGGQ